MLPTFTPPLTIGQCATLACLLEAMAPKAGNVNRDFDFEDLRLSDLVISATVIGPHMDAAGHRSVGETGLSAVRSTRAAVNTNSNLGVILLLAPLAKSAAAPSVREHLANVLEGLTVDDARKVYEAIRLAKPGGMGTVSRGDIRQIPQETLGALMAQAAERDLIARQYANGFREVLEFVVPGLQEEASRGRSIDEAIVRIQLRIMARFPDSLMVRKCGTDVAQRASRQAAEVLALSGPQFRDSLAALDEWLRVDGNRRNPGTTADLIAAGLFLVLVAPELQRVEGPDLKL